MCHPERMRRNRAQSARGHLLDRTNASIEYMKRSPEVERRPLRCAQGDNPLTCHLSLLTVSSSPLTVSIVSASSAFLSVRQRTIRGNLTAIPDLWREDR